MKKMISILLACTLLLFAGCAAGQGDDAQTPVSQVASSENTMEAVDLVLEHVNVDELDYNAFIDHGTKSVDGVEYNVVAAGTDSDEKFTATAYYYVSIDGTAIYQMDMASNALTQIWEAGQEEPEEE